MTSGGVATAAAPHRSGNESPLYPLGGKDTKRNKEMYDVAVSNQSNLDEYVDIVKLNHSGGGGETVVHSYHETSMANRKIHASTIRSYFETNVTSNHTQNRMVRISNENATVHMINGLGSMAVTLRGLLGDGISTRYTSDSLYLKHLLFIRNSIVHIPSLNNNTA